MNSVALRDLVLVIIGDELLEGRRIDRHASFLTRTLGEWGLVCQRVVIIRDQHDVIVETVQRSMEEAELVIVTGGLGPTVDDITREAVAEATGISLAQSDDALAEIEARFRAMGRSMSPNNYRQAMAPTAGGYFSNPNGTAPGLYYQHDQGVVIALPGPPRELEPMIDDQVVPFLRKHYALGGERCTAVLSFACVGESTVDYTIHEMLGTVEDLKVSMLARPGVVNVTLALEGDEETMRPRLDQYVSRIQEKLGDYSFGGTDLTLEEAVGRLLVEQGQTVAVAESCTGGLLGASLTEAAGASAYFRGGVIAYDNTVKINALGVDAQDLEQAGAVSQAAASQMAQGVCRTLHSDWGISITGVAGPGGGTDEKPVGTVWIAVAQNDKAVYPFTMKFAGNRSMIRQRSCIYGLDQLRRLLQGIEPHESR